MNTLRDWEEWIDEQVWWLGEHVEAHRFPADRAKTLDWLEGEALLLSVPLERAIRHFAGTWQWPELSPAEAFHLALRLHLGCQAVEEWTRPGDTPAKAAMPAPPNPTEREAFLRWLLLDVWSAVGAFFMQHWTSDLMRSNPPAQ